MVGDACESDDDCADATRCLALLPGRAASCVAPPSCVDSTPANGDGAAWSATDGACVTCAACTGKTGAAGPIWPTTSADGECLCETLPGFYIDVARAVDGPRPCDADNDGWVQRPVRQYLRSDDVALRDNARCTPTTVTVVRLINERSEQLDLDPAVKLGAVEPLTLYEPATLDEQARLNVTDDIPDWGGMQPQAEWLNPLTKLCVNDTADFNANGLSDLAEAPGAALEANQWMQPFLQLSHFAELHTVQIDADAGVLMRPRLPPRDHRRAGRSLAQL